jgi:hypothetical protein
LKEKDHPYKPQHPDQERLNKLEDLLRRSFIKIEELNKSLEDADKELLAQKEAYQNVVKQSQEKDSSQTGRRGLTLSFEEKIQSLSDTVQRQSKQIQDFMQK